MYKTLKTFYKFALKKRLIFCVFVVLVLSSSILGAIIPYFYKLFVNALTTAQTDKLFGIVLLYIGVSVAALVTGIVSYIVSDMIVFEASTDVRRAIFKHVLDLDFVFHASKSTGSLISAFKRGDGAFFDLFHIIHHRVADVVI